MTCRDVADKLLRRVAVGSFLDRDILADKIGRDPGAGTEVIQHCLHFARKRRRGCLAGVHPAHALVEPAHHVVSLDRGNAVPGDGFVNVECPELYPVEHRSCAAVKNLNFFQPPVEKSCRLSFEREHVRHARAYLELIGAAPQDINADNVPEP